MSQIATFSGFFRCQKGTRWLNAFEKAACELVSLTYSTIMGQARQGGRAQEINERQKFADGSFTEGRCNGTNNLPSLAPIGLRFLRSPIEHQERRWKWILR
jgi:hypothetical protein